VFTCPPLRSVRHVHEKRQVGNRPHSARYVELLESGGLRVSRRTVCPRDVVSTTGSCPFPFEGPAPARASEILSTDTLRS
jgi:hypothetical protein